MSERWKKESVCVCVYVRGESRSEMRGEGERESVCGCEWREGRQVERGREGERKRVRGGNSGWSTGEVVGMRCRRGRERGLFYL